MHFNALIPELAVTSIAGSRRFYCDLLCFSVAYDRPEEGFAFLELGDAQLMLDEIGIGRTFDGGAPLTRPLGRGLNLQIRVAAVDVLLAALAGAGWPLYLPLEEKWYRRGDAELGNRQFVVADPDGYLLRFFEELGARPLQPDRKKRGSPK
jgi:catechol 2,3-dioxygenase-like lactoylglutathione lyase family enzyme